MEQIWLAAGLNPLNETLVLLGLADTEAECKTQLTRADDDVVYRRVFLMTGPQFAREMHVWLRSCGIVENEAIDLLRQFGAYLQRMMDESESGER